MAALPWKARTRPTWTVVAETSRLKGLGSPIIATQDWHPADHISFFTNHEGKAAFETIDLGGREQILWPSHCVQNTDLIPNLCRGVGEVTTRAALEEMAAAGVVFI